MIRKTPALLCAAVLAGCVAGGPEQPEGAPPPSAANQVLVDKDGCTWWVVGNVNAYLWSPRIDPQGRHICDRILDGISPRDVVDANPASPERPMPAPSAATGPVTLDELPEPAPEQAPFSGAPVAQPMAARTPAASGGYVVQVASFGQPANASASQTMFAALGLPASGAEAPGPRGLYVLTLGPFADRDDAERALATARAEGFADAFVSAR